ncbi:DNA-binding protein [Lactobacillus amylolyticus]|uniref:helix-turn-helix domain-containing protein n=1 Tax=Lactobacillus amylolyticus TaxID=83683 RepID=UPI0009BC663D|nr:helix-turn-helix domain-containing protein [Lactobacillus amylolyticus]ARD06915.1 DNA-binding protein [Lactobacillus amylolyticus]
MTKQLLSFKEAQQYLGFKSPASLREYIEQGLTVVQVGKSKRIDLDDLKQFVNEHKVSKKVN